MSPRGRHFSERLGTLKKRKTQWTLYKELIAETNSIHEKIEGEIPPHIMIHFGFAFKSNAILSLGYFCQCISISILHYCSSTSLQTIPSPWNDIWRNGGHQKSSSGKQFHLCCFVLLLFTLHLTQRIMQKFLMNFEGTSVISMCSQCLILFILTGL